MASGQIVPLSDLTPASKRVTICVRLSRMWEYFNKERELAHLDLVVVDETGSKMYAEIAAVHAMKFRQLLIEEQVYLMRDFFVQSAKNMFRAVEGRFMIKTTPWTKIEQKTAIPAAFPRYAYSLTNFDRLVHLIGRKESFLDAIGVVVEISELLTVRLPGQSRDCFKRNLRLMDIDRRTIDVALWGNLAASFDGDGLYKKGQSEPLIILLVGTLMKDYRGHETISCGEAAKCYINPDIPEAAAYRDSFGKQLPILKWISAADDQYQKTYKQTEPMPVKVQALISTDPNDFIDKNLVCTVMFTKVKSPTWWFLACSRCHKTAYSAATEFTCSDSNCTSTAAEPRYKVSMLGTDGTGEAEFIFFGVVAEQIIGKQVDILIRTVARRPNAIPAEISALVTQKYTLNISIAEKGLHYGYVAFQVNNIDIAHPKVKSSEFSALVSASTQLPVMESVPGTSQPSPSSIEVSDADQSDVQTMSTEIALTSPQNTADLATPPPTVKPYTEPLTDQTSGTKNRAPKRSLDEKNKNAPVKKLFK